MSTQVICSMCGVSVKAEDYDPELSLKCPQCTDPQDDADAGLFASEEDEYEEDEDTDV